jgi:hypothetical protein
MRRVLGRGGRLVALCGALWFAACAEDPASIPVPTGSAGSIAPGGVGGVGGPLGMAGSITFGGSSGTAQPPGGLDGCGVSALHVPVTRYSAADINGSLSLIFGDGPEPPGPPLADAGRHERELSALFVRNLLRLARARTEQAAKDARALVVCEDEQDMGPECAQQWLRDFGSQLYRRPLSPEQVAAYLVLFRSAQSEEETAQAAWDALTAMVLSPYFVLRLELGRTDDPRILPHEVAARLSHFATRRAPDRELVASAASGKLYEPAERLVQLHRLWGTPAGRAARELQYLEWLGINEAHVPSELPPELVADMNEQARGFVSDVFDEHNGSLDMFYTGSRLPLNDRLATHYGLPLPGSDTLVSVELEPKLFAGLLSTGAFLARFPRPTARGKQLMDALFCTPVPEPSDPGHAQVMLADAATPRERIQQAVAVSPGCQACHATFDPVGFALEAFDDQGRLSGLDTTGAITPDPTVAGVMLENPGALARVALSTPSGRQCFQRRYLEYVLDAELPPGSLARSIAPPGTNMQPVVIQEESAEQRWINCLGWALSAQNPSLTALAEAVAMSSLMLTRDDLPRRVVAFDNNQDPLEHAYQEARQLVGSYPALDDNSTILRYVAALEQARGTDEPQGGAGAGGAP